VPELNRLRGRPPNFLYQDVTQPSPDLTQTQRSLASLFEPENGEEIRKIMFSMQYIISFKEVLARLCTPQLRSIESRNPIRRSNLAPAPCFTRIYKYSVLSGNTCTIVNRSKHRESQIETGCWSYH
jgi:hypothetical protein